MILTWDVPGQKYFELNLLTFVFTCISKTIYKTGSILITDNIETFIVD